MMIEKVHLEIFHNNFAERNLFIAQITVEKTRGTTMYLPMRINKSVKNTTNSLTFTFSKGRINDAIIPKAIPIKYLIQTFILFHYIILWNVNL